MSDDAKWLRLVVPTDQGLFLRQVPGASALPAGEVGSAAETATRHAAMYSGLPDFVFRSAVRSRGRGVRELGDVIICVGDVAAVVQVKARAEVSPDAAREAAWLAKKIPAAIRQASGTLRSFARKEREILVNERGNRVEVVYGAKAWVPVVVVDHPAAEGFVPGPGAVVVWRRDWEFLFDQLKSTDAVIRYLHRVHALEPVPLGREPVRYYEMAAADAAAPPKPMDLTGLAGNPVRGSVPELPQAPAGSDSHRHHLFLQRLLEDIAASPCPANVSEGEFLDVLAAIDTMPVGYRTELGRLLLTWLQKVLDVPAGEIAWRTRRYLGEHERLQLVFTAATRYTAEVASACSFACGTSS